MRLVSATLAVLLGLSGALHPGRAGAQAGPETTASLPPPTVAAPRAAATKPVASLRDSYAAIPLNERIAVQADLTWAGLYSGPLNGEYSEPFVAAVKAFQRQNKTKQTGVLNPAERQALTETVRPLQDQVGWRTVSDASTGARLGVPTKLAPIASSGKTGSTWSSAQGQVRIETFRITAPDATLASVFEQQKTEPVERKISQQAMHDDYFVIIGMQGLKKFHVRAYSRDGEIRGITILYDQAMEVAMDQIVLPLANSFQPFTSVAAPKVSTPRRKVEYGTGLVVSASGHIVTDFNVTDGCQSVIVPGVGRAEVLAEDRDNNLALLRVYGAEDLAPLALLGEAARGPDLMLLGIADPQSQAGGASISSVNVRVSNTTSTGGTVTTLSQTPGLGFSGAAALDKSGRFYGMVGLKVPMVAGTAPATPKASIVPAETIRNFMEANYVAPVSGQSGAESCKASVVRIICVRK